MSDGRYQLPTAALGRTGLQVTRLGIGGAYCSTVEGYRAALDCGVNYVDTARTYRDGDDERVIGEALVGRRNRLLLSSKTQKRDAAGARAELETSLRLLRTDYLDIWQIHYLNTAADRAQALGSGGAYEAALKAREEGLVRFIGVTGHDWPEIYQAVATGLFDTVLCWYSCAFRQAEEQLFPAAMQHNTGVIIMNASRNDKLLNDPAAPPAEQFYRYVLGHPAVHMTVFGLRNLELFCHVARALAERDSLSAEERRELEAYGARLLAEDKLKMG
jgi:aryl-alcohol dehydrogenase-like predicted oxidoreductase